MRDLTIHIKNIPDHLLAEIEDLLDEGGIDYRQSEPYGRTVVQARDWVRDHRRDGVFCPCCDQRAQEYRRQIYGEMGRFLAIAYAKKTHEWFHGPSLVPELRGGDTAKLIYWGLIEPMPDKIRKDGSSRTGWWRVTSKGASFVKGSLRVPKYVVVFDGQFLEYEGELISITDVMGKEFNFTELMAGV